MLVLQECIVKLEKFKETFSQKFGIIMYELNEALTELFNCKVDLVRFRDSLRPLFKSNIQKDVIYV